MTYKPTWARYREGMSSTNLDIALKSTDAYQEEKAKELKTSKVARDWEKSKNEALMKEKPAWVKAREDANVAPLKKAVKELKVGGQFDTGIKPMPGFVLVKPEFKETTDSGLILVNDDAQKMQANVGTVLAIGDKRIDLMEVVQPPVKEGEKVMFKKGLPGLEMDIRGEYCLLMTWSDLLGVLQ